MLAFFAMRQRAGSQCALAVGLLCLATSGGADTPATLQWELVEISPPRRVWTGEETLVRAVIRNVGSETWSSSELGDHFGYHWLSPDGNVVEFDGMRTVYPRSVRPGETIEFQARLGPPPGPGEWLLEWQPVREQVGWLGPPVNGQRVLHPVRTRERIAYCQAIFFALSGVVVVGGWVLRRRPTLEWWYLLIIPAVWCVVGLTVQAQGFLQRAGYGVQPQTLPFEIAAAALEVLPVVLAPLRWRSKVASFLVLFAAIIAYADVVHFRFFGSLVPLTGLHAARQIGQLTDSLVALTRSADLWFAVGGSAALLVALGLRAGGPTPPKTPLDRFRGFSAMFLITCLVAWPAVTALGSALAPGGMAVQVFSHDQMLRQWGVGVTHLVDVVRTGSEYLASRRPNAATRQRVMDYFRARQATLAPPTPCSGLARGNNLLLVQVESLQQWVVGAQVGGVEVTPFLNSLRRQALYFPFVFDQSDQGRSSDGEFIALNSLHALDRGAVAFRRAGNHFHALPRVLAEAGYTTLSAHAFEPGFWNRAVLHPRYGFQTSYFRGVLGSGEEIGWGLADRIFFERMVPRLAAQPQPFMALLITLGLHHPFEGFPTQHRQLQLGELEHTPLGHYLQSMHYVDSALAKLYGAMAETGLAENTVIAIYGDHDAGFDPTGKLLRFAGFAEEDESVGPRIDRVPLFVILPSAGEECRGERSVEGGHLDIAPTLLDVLGVAPPPAFLGTSLLRERRWPVAGPYGTAAFKGVIGAATEVGVWNQGGCWELDTGRPLPMASCQPLLQQAREERAISHLVLLTDMVEEINRSLGR